MAMMIKHTVFTTLLIVASSSELAMDKRDTFSPFDPKDTQSVFTKNDLKDALLVARLKSERDLKPSKTVDSIHFRHAAVPSITPLPPKITKPDDASIINNSNKKDGSLYYYYYPSESENKEIYVDAPSYGVYDIEASSYGGVGSSGFFDMEAEHIRYLVKVALPLFLIGGLLLGLSAFSASNSRSLDEHGYILSRIEAEIQKISEGYFPMSDECLDRIICEVGYATAGSSFAEKMLSFVEGIFPQGVIKKLDVFKSGALNKSGAQICPAYGCQIPHRNEVKKTS